MMTVSRLAGRFDKFTGRISLSGEFYPPDARRRDLDNVLKCTLDSLVHAGLMDDDSQIKEISIRMHEPIPPEGLVYVKLAPLSERFDRRRLQSSPNEEQ